MSQRIASQQSTAGASTIQEFAYTYDNVGNMLTRQDVFHRLTETFTYDTLDRLTSASVGAGAPVNYGFNPIGNLVEKTDVGTSHLYNLSQVHAVSEVVGGGSLPSHTLAYDANGNMDTQNGMPVILWSSYDKPVAIGPPSVGYTFDYGPDRARYRKVHGGLTTHYVGKGFEAINSTGIGFDVHRHYVRANGRVVMIREDANGSVTHRYVHTDHLGSITALTDETSDAVVGRYSYDAWGLRRNPTTWQPGAIISQEKRGYTGHEHMDDVGLIHMNGRIYSPSLGRMLSPDPVTFAPEDAQGYNRYSYVLNNPLRYTDPSGFQPKKDVKPIDPVNSPGAMEHVAVIASRVSPNSSYVSGLNGSSLALGSGGNGGNGGNSPGSAFGDSMGHAGNPVAEVEQNDAPPPRVCGEYMLECTTTTTAENLRNTLLANYQRFLQQVQMDQLFWQDMGQRSGNAATALAGVGVLVGGAPAIATSVTILTAVNIGSAFMGDGVDGAATPATIFVTQIIFQSALGRIPILGNHPAAVGRLTLNFGFLGGMATLDTAAD